MIDRPLMKDHFSRNMSDWLDWCILFIYDGKLEKLQHIVHVAGDHSIYLHLE